jgi:predicted DNA-binding ribbon-helix-helix protein
VKKSSYKFEKRSLVIDGKDTKISMEQVYWVVLEKLAKIERVTWRKFVISVLSIQPDDYESRAGWLRVYVAGYAYIFFTRPTWMHNPPKRLMQWDNFHSAFKFPVGKPG